MRRVSTVKVRDGFLKVDPCCHNYLLFVIVTALHLSVTVDELFDVSLFMKSRDHVTADIGRAA